MEATSDPPAETLPVLDPAMVCGGRCPCEPAAHGADGRAFGGAVSHAAQNDVGWLVTHVSGGRG